MHSLLLAPTAWAQLEVGSAQLGDVRRTKRLVQVTTALAQNPHGTLPASFPDWKNLKAAYRLLEQDAVTHERILAPHVERTRRAAQGPGTFLWIEDTTTLDFSGHPAAQDLGPVAKGHGRGFLAHNALVLRVEDWDRDGVPRVQVQGLAGQQCWTRPEEPLKKKDKSKEGRLQRQRESRRWAQFGPPTDPPAPHGQGIYVADRESDIYEVFERCTQRAMDFVIRACRPRALAGEDQSVLAAVARARVRGHLHVALRARPGQPARTARMALRARTVTLRGPWRPEGRPAPRTVQVVEVREVRPPAGVVPVVWVLLTSLRCRTTAQIKRVVGLYTQRWLIEEFHKALKSGTQMEASQLETARGLQALCAVLSLVALRLVQSKLYARACPDAPVPASQWPRPALRLLAAKVGRPAAGWTQRTVWRGIARLGGFIGRRGDGEPGWLTIWRGWRRLMIMMEGVELPHGKRTKKCG